MAALAMRTVWIVSTPAASWFDMLQGVMYAPHCLRGRLAGAAFHTSGAGVHRCAACLPTVVYISVPLVRPQWLAKQRWHFL